MVMEKTPIPTNEQNVDDSLSEKMKEVTEQATRKVRNFRRRYFQRMSEDLKKQKKSWAK
jgi:hypothetical protein